MIKAISNNHTPYFRQSFFDKNHNNNYYLIKNETDTVKSGNPRLRKTLIGAAAAGIVIGTAIVSRKKIASLFTGNTIKQVDVSAYKGVDLNEYARNEFMECFINLIKKPVVKLSPEGKIIKRCTPENGYLVYGPDSKAKEQYFNWMVSELENAGVEIYDAGKGKKAKFKEVGDAWWDMWNSNSDEEFLQKGKYKALIVRGLDEIGQPPNGKITFPDGVLLKDSPDSHNSCKRHGIMVFYSCKNPGKLDPAVIRPGRVDIRHLPQPLDDEPLDIWKEYLKYAKNFDAPFAYRAIEAAKEVLSKRGPEVMEEMKEHLAYSIPYEPPIFSEPLKKWQLYISKTAENVNKRCRDSELKKALRYIKGEAEENSVNMEKFNAIRKMTDEIQAPEDLQKWQRIVDAIVKGNI